MADSKAATSEACTSSSQPAPYGSEFTSCGLPSRSLLTADTLPETGAYRSDTDFVDSTSPKDSPAVTSVPRSGSWTKTPSSSADCAKTVILIPTVTPAMRFGIIDFAQSALGDVGD